MREWGALYGMPYAIKVDSGPAFRLTFEQEMEDYCVKIIHSSAYHPQSQGLVERSVRMLKEIWEKIFGPFGAIFWSFGAMFEVGVRFKNIFWNLLM